MLKHKYKNVLSLFLLVIVLASCGQVGTIMPQAVDEEVDVCAACSMMVQDNQYSAQIVQTSGQTYKFDDVGCMAMYINDNQPEGQLYVRDFYSSEWIEADQALFVQTEEIETPMNYGFLAFSSGTNLDKFLAESSGEEITWNDVIKTMKERSSHDENEHSHH